MFSILKRFFAKKTASTSGEEAQASQGLVALNISELPGPPPVMHVHERMDRHISREIQAHGIWEADETRLLMALLREGQTFVDVGANIGYFTILGARLVGSSGSVVAFEPDPENFRLLQDNVRLNSLANVSAEQLALSDRSGVGQLYLSADNLGDHTIFCDDDSRRSVEISLTTGDQYFSDYQRPLDIIKMDVQGSEYQALAGLAPVIMRSMPRVAVLLEFTPNRLRAAGSSGAELLDLLVELGFIFYIFDLRRHGLLRCEAFQIGKWVRLTEMAADSEGFINLVCCGDSLGTLPGIDVDNNEDGKQDPLEYLLTGDLAPWDGSLCAAPDMNKHLYFSAGWSFPEPWGVWSDGHVSRIKFLPMQIDASAREIELHFTGRYFAGGESTVVSVNGVELDHCELSDYRLCLSADFLRCHEVEITLQHKDPSSPAELDGSSDDRRLKYGLESLAWRTVDSGADA